jgi:hypothetical protein
MIPEISVESTLCELQSGINQASFLSLSPLKRGVQQNARKKAKSMRLDLHLDGNTVLQKAVSILSLQGKV